jgi:hypothetical protein
MSDSEKPRDEASPDAAEVAHKATEDAETEFHPFDELDEDFKPSPALRVSGPDGLPLTVDQTTQSDIPALSKDTLICMGDFSSFVVRDQWRAELYAFPPSDVERAPDGRWRISIEKVIERCRPLIAECRAALGVTVANFTDEQLILSWFHTNYHSGTAGFLVVEPKRPPCRHYVRQAIDREIYRLCAARRTTEGTFMTVRDLSVRACDMRDPYDPALSARLDEFDEMKIEEGAHREYLPMFGGGIFDSKGGDK